MKKIALISNKEDMALVNKTIIYKKIKSLKSANKYNDSKKITYFNLRIDDKLIEFYNLPSINSLSENSSSKIEIMDFFIKEIPELLIVVIDINDIIKNGDLKCNFSLLLEILKITNNVILCLTSAYSTQDLFKNKKFTRNDIEKILGIKVVLFEKNRKKIGLENLKIEIYRHLSINNSTSKDLDILTKDILYKNSSITYDFSTNVRTNFLEDDQKKALDILTNINHDFSSKLDKLSKII